MTTILSQTYTTLVSLTSALDNPVTITDSGLLEAGLSATISSSTPWTITNYGIVSGSGISLFAAGTVVNAASIAATTGLDAINFSGDGSVTNQSGAEISGGQIGIIGYGASLYVTNAANATITGYSGIVGFGIDGFGHAVLTVVNAGDIGVNTLNGSGIILQAGGSVTNQATGTITARHGVYGQLVAATVVNYGHITANGTILDASVQLNAGGTVTNESGGTISGYRGALGGKYGALTIVNAGVIAGNPTASSGVGVVLEGGGTVTNLNTAMISGFWGIFGETTPATVVNYGSIAGNTSEGVGVQMWGGGSVTNQSGGSIRGGIYGIAGQFAAMTVTNAGDIAPDEAFGTGIKLGAGGNVTNQSTGTITGGYRGIWGYGSPVTVVNYGDIRANEPEGSGVTIGAGGSVTNQSGGTIGGHFGIYGSNSAITVANAGDIAGAAANGFGVDLQAGGYITNQNTGTISGGAFGILGTGPAVTVVNAGSIAGTGPFGKGVFITAGGSVTNLSTGTISGYDGIYGAGGVTVVNQGGIDGTGFFGVSLHGGGTVANYGTIAVTGFGTDAVTLEAGYANLLKMGPDAVFIGTASGGNVIGAPEVSTLELTAGTTPGTLSGLGTTIVDFAQIIIDPGATWTLASVPVGYTVTDLGTLINAGSFSAPITLASGGYLRNASGSTIVGTGLAAIQAGSGATVVNAGDVDPATYGVYLPGGGSVTNVSGGTIIGTVAGVKISGATGTVVNAGGIYGTGFRSYGVELTAGGTVINAGTIAGNNDSVLFAGGFANRLVVDPSAYFSGAIYGGNPLGATAVSTLELAPGTSAGTLTGLGDQIESFVQVTIDSDAAWTLVSNYLTAGYTISNAGTLTNTGTLQSPVMLAAGAALTNAYGGMLYSASGYAVYSAITSAGVSVLNGGVILSPGSTAIALADGGSVTNQSTGTISGGGATGVYIIGAPGTVVNAGLITGSGLGVLFTGAAGTVVNYGIITGSDAGVEFNPGGSNTLIDAGLIASGRYAVRFSSGYANRLVLDPSAVLTGSITGGNTPGASAVSTLELASGATAGTLTGLGNTIVDFAQITIDSGASWTLLSDTLASGYGINDSGTLIAAALTGTGSVTISADSTLEVQGTVSSGETIVFAGAGAYLHIDSPYSFAGGITNFTATDSIDLKDVAPAMVSYATGALDYGTSGSIALSVSPLVPLAKSASTDGTDITALCFCANTRILTPSGARPVRDLAVGDVVTTWSGGQRPISWIGVGRVLATRGRRGAATPVIVRKGALADNVPARNLHVTKGHALYLDDVLIPVEFLVNHRSIVWDDRAQEVELYHIELDAHDVLIANGAPAESYRDDGNRWLFRNANTGWDQPEKPPCAPVLTGGPIVDAVWRRLRDRAGPGPNLPLTEEPDLHLLVDGRRVDGSQQQSGWHIFDLPHPPGELRIVSRAGSPAEMGLARDPRMLGVAVRQVRLWQGARVRVLEVSDESLDEGFHAFEQDNGFRWTDGDAVLPAALFEGFEGTCQLELLLGGATRYPLLAEPADRAAA